MLKKLNQSYFFISCAVFFFLIFWVQPEYFSLYLFNVFTFLGYFFVINSSVRMQAHDSLRLFFIVIGYSLVFVSLYNFISFSYEGNFFLFSEKDAIVYHDYAKEMANKSWTDSTNYFLRFYTIEDLGIVLVLSAIYSIAESNLLFNAFNILVGTVIAIGIFRISKYFMSPKYAFICALSFSLSSYIMWFHSSGLKESLMLMLVVLFFDQYYIYIQDNKRKNIITALLFALSLILFRPVLMFFCVGSMGLGILFERGTSLKKILTAGIVIILIALSFSYLEVAFERFLRGGDVDKVIADREAEGMIKGGLAFTYSVNFLAQVIGPLPSALPNLSPQLSFYSSGLIFRVLLSFSFWLGVYFAFKFRLRVIYPLIFFALVEMASLTIILEGLELRKSLPHIPMVYILAFWFMDSYKKGLIKNKTFIQGVFISFSVVVSFLIIYWNFR